MVQVDHTGERKTSRAAKKNVGGETISKQQ